MEELTEIVIKESKTKEIFKRIIKDKKLRVFAAGYIIFESISIYSQYKAIQEKSVMYQISACVTGWGLAKICLYLSGGEILYNLSKEKINKTYDKIIYSDLAMKVGPCIPRM